MAALADKLKQIQVIKKKGSKDTYSYQQGVSYVALIKSYLETRKEFVPFDAHIKRNELIGFHPSGLYEACPRQVAFSYIHEKGLFKPELYDDELSILKMGIKNPNLEAIFDLGHLIHMLHQYSYLKGAAKESSYKVEVSVKNLYEEYLIGGTADIVIRLQDSEWYLIDIKSIGVKAFYSITDKAYVEDKYYHYIVQLMIYLKGLNLKTGDIVFHCKDNGDMKEFFFDYDESIISGSLKTATRAKNFVSGTSYVKILKECKSKKGLYKNCKFKDICFQCLSGKDLLAFTTKKTNKEIIREGNKNKKTRA